jgi:5-methylcytosine-specific restriction endonuclease McrA
MIPKNSFDSRQTFTPCPKPGRISNPDLIEWVRKRRDGVCLIGKDCSGGLDVHHIKHKGAGGDDVEENLITLCRKHHNLAHEYKITPEELRRVLGNQFRRLSNASNKVQDS